MKYNIKNLVLETVGEVLLEGRLEDVKAKYDDEFSDIIDDLSRLDPSGNNKYLSWMANQYFNVDEGGIGVTQIGQAVARYHKELARINPNMSKEVVEANPDLYPGRETRRVSNNPKDINSFGSVKGLIKVIEVAEENVPTSTERDKIYQDDKWTVIVPKTHQASCKYGVHSNWCVSTSNSYYYKNYTEQGMLAFVLWRGEQEGQMGMKGEGEYKVAAYIKYQDPNYTRWEWYNKKDTRMDNDLPISIFPPALISAIQNQVKSHMRTSGYLVDVDFEEIEQKSHVLKMYGSEGEMTYTFTPKKEHGLDWLSKYNKNGRIKLTNDKFDIHLPIFSVSEPRGELRDHSIDLSGMYRSLTTPDYWSRNSNKETRFKNALPYDIRSGYNETYNLDETKQTELWDYFKTYFVENYNGYLEVGTDTLGIGDEVTWKRTPARLQRQLGSKVGKIVRQTPSGMFVVDIVDEDKPSRFKPSPGKMMKKKFNSTNLDVEDLFSDPVTE
jgi:hypothetical protein